MQETLRYTLIFLLGSLSLVAQVPPSLEPDYDWVWAVNGGGEKNIDDIDPQWRGSYYIRQLNYEQVVDIKVDKENNSYVLALIGQMNTKFNGQPVSVYNYEGHFRSSTDVILISLDCEGHTRWTQVIGGYYKDKAYSLGLDEQGGVYVGLSIINDGSHIVDSNPNHLLERKPVHFDASTHLPYMNDLTGEESYVPHESFKSLALAKYQTTDGSLAWVQFPEGLIAKFSPTIKDIGYQMTHLFGRASKVITEKDGTTHWLVAFRPGTYLDGTVVVAETPPYFMYHEYWVLVYKADGTIKRSFKVPLTTNDNKPWKVDDPQYNAQGLIIHDQDHHNFWYDSVKKQYYLGGYFDGSGGVPNPSFGGKAFERGSYVLAFDLTGKELWRTTADKNLNAEIRDVKTDKEGGVYITGILSTYWNLGLQKHESGYFGTYKVEGTGGVPYVMKLSPEKGQVEWATIGTSKPSSTGSTDNRSSSGERLTITDKEVVLAMRMGPLKWGSLDSGIVYGEYYNPFLIRFDKKDGSPKAQYRINTGKHTPSGLLAVEVDSDGNFITGGFHSSPMFYDHPTMPLLANVGGHADFFVAKLAASECGTPVLSNETWQGNSLQVSPNPTADKVYWDAHFSYDYYQVYDLSGKLVLQGKVDHPELSLQSLATGTYQLVLTGARGVKGSVKVMVRK